MFRICMQEVLVLTKQELETSLHVTKVETRKRVVEEAQGRDPLHHKLPVWPVFNDN